ncbi:mediator of RNA polymerase II transcription subunit 29-like [Daphnia carinata]|uniref:mediator of RNA polymerase II transcription subunit 29-like n=1 Tax=Daphnia carinata TaxID=120202 RepID=UPI00257B53BD|nr:mediator of RNA polymerase II transcription subunit 29-like [Daphnia carinata]
MAMHMSGMSNQGAMMNMTPLQQQQLLQQQQQQQQQAPGNNNPQQMLQHQQQQPLVPTQQVAANPSMPNPTASHPTTEQQKLDHIAKVKTLLWPLKESLITSFKTAAQNFNQNGMIDFGTMKGTEANIPRFDKQLEDFYSICDQIELNLQAAIGCASQVSTSQRHVPSQVTVVRQEPVINQEIISYPNYVGVAKTQVAYVKDVIDTLNDAAQNLSND